MYRVLIADDEQGIRTGLKVLVDWQELGFAIVEEAENGQEALGKMKNGKIDVLFTDIRMPEMDGLELIKTVRAEYPGCRIIIISAYTDFSYVKTAMTLGARNYLLKPVNEEELEQAFLELRKELDLDRISNIKAEAGLRQICMDACRMEKNSGSIIMQIKDYIEENYSKDINIKSISKQFSYNPCYIGRFYAQHEGMSIKEYINKCRIRNACILVLEGRLKMSDIASITGFSGMNKFYSAFKAVVGCTPMEYRKSRLDDME